MELLCSSSKYLIILGSAACIIISKNYFIESKLSRFEIPILILFSTLGMMVLISSNDLITMYLGIELQSLALYVVASIKRDSLRSSESGVKYFILGALSSGILLYGCSLIYGFSGSTNFQEIQINLSSLTNLNLGLTFGLVFVLTGLAFKVSAVPFHMWTPDVYEGAPTSVTAFFAIVPKVSAVAIIYRFCLEPFGNFYSEWSQIIIFLSIASMFLGAIAAISQKNIKRLLAYSSIGHVGYILIGVAAANEESIKGMCNLVSEHSPLLAGVDSRGFIFASAMAERLNLGLLLLRKGGKLPPPKIDIEYELEYGLGKLEIKEAQKKGTEIVLIDDILATGGTMSAACDLCLKAGYKVKQALVLIDLILLINSLFLGI